MLYSISQLASAFFVFFSGAEQAAEKFFFSKNS